MKNRIFTLAMIILLLFTLGCGLVKRIRGLVAPETPPEAETSSEAPLAPIQPPVAEDTEQTEEPAETSVEPESTESEQSASAVSSNGETMTFTGSSNLDQLSSYQAFMSVNFDGVSNGQPAQGYIDITMEATKNPEAMHAAITLEGSMVEQMGGANNMEFYNVDGTIYMFTPLFGDQWVSMPSADSESFTEGFITPDEDLELPDTAVCDSGTEDINGILTTHCSFTEADINSEGITYTSLSGDVWVAQEGYIVKYNINGEIQEAANQGVGDFLDTGNISIAYELSNVNENFIVTPPDEALNAQSFDLGNLGGDGSDTTDSPTEPETSDAPVEGETSDLPMLNDAHETLSVAGITSYYTNADVATVIDFYRQELALAGWNEEADTAFINETTGLLTFVKDGTSLIITLNLEDDGRVNVGLVTTNE